MICDCRRLAGNRFFMAALPCFNASGDLHLPGISAWNLDRSVGQVFLGWCWLFVPDPTDRIMRM